MKPEEIAALRQLSEWLQEPACGEDMLASENVRKIVIAAKSVGPLLEHIDLQAEQITQANHRYTELQNVCDDQEKEIKRLEEDSTELATARSYIKVLEAKKNQEGLMDACETLTKRMDKQRVALKKLGEMVRARGEALVEERAKHVAVSRLTDEQRQAIDVAVQIMENEISELSGEEYMGAVHARTRIESHAAVLRAMLEDA